jgi:toxin ParE1/3/4
VANPRYTRTARRDAQGIEDYLAGRSQPAAERFLRELGRQAAMHARMPGMGRRIGPFAPGVRRFLIERKYVALYRATDGGILILRVLHGSRDIPAVFAADPGDD